MSAHARLLSAVDDYFAALRAVPYPSGPKPHPYQFFRHQIGAHEALLPHLFEYSVNAVAALEVARAPEAGEIKRAVTVCHGTLVAVCVQGTASLSVIRAEFRRELTPLGFTSWLD
jgi:hypothetical protein